MSTYPRFARPNSEYKHSQSNSLARIAQLVEHTTDTGGVLGSNPSARTELVEIPNLLKNMALIRRRFIYLALNSNGIDIILLHDIM